MKYNKWIGKLKFLEFNIMDFMDTMQHVEIDEIIDFLREAEKNNKTKSDICNDFVNYVPDDDEIESEEKETLSLTGENVPLEKTHVEKPKSLEDVLTENNIQIG